ncbi:hypothetical protein [Rhizobium sp. SGZ-381]|uniref:hypothetical protein n=1 Tax=Rhizobium sp. SGZ-381 TaxID=3342800 RepID=UPI00366C8715
MGVRKVTACYIDAIMAHQGVSAIEEYYLDDLRLVDRETILEVEAGRDWRGPRRLINARRGVPFALRLIRGFEGEATR